MQQKFTAFRFHHFIVSLFLLQCLLLSFEGQAQQLFLAGDSTLADKAAKDLPETGWGSPFAHFFSEQLSVLNLAKNGRSTKTFISEGRWQNLLDQLQTGDHVIIQFGHNDEVPGKKDRYTTPSEYKTNLRTMIRQVREKQAHALLLSPVTRRYFDAHGQIKVTHPYTQLLNEVVKETNVTYIDMDKVTRTYFSGLGDTLSSLRFMHLRPGMHPNYPNGVKDDTHFNELGAREVAQLVLAELKRIEHPLIQYLRTPDPKHLTFHF